jgi:hypothetical protein
VKRIIIEAYITGRDVGVFGLFLKGELQFHDYVLRQVHDVPHCLPKRYQIQKAFSDTEKELLKTDFEALARALGVSTGPFYTEYRLTDDGERCFALECEPTLPAYAAKLISNSIGRDLNELFVDVVVSGRLPDLSADNRRYSACRFIYSETTGVIEAIKVGGNLPLGCEVYLHSKVGDQLDNTSARSVCAVAFGTGQDAEQVETAIDRTVAAVTVETST